MAGASRNVKAAQRQTESSSKRDATIAALEDASLSAAELVALRLETLRKSPKGDPISTKAWMGIGEQVGNVMQSIQTMRGGAVGQRTAADFAADIRAQCVAADSLMSKGGS